MQGCARQPWQRFETTYFSSAHALHAKLMMLMSGGLVIRLRLCRELRALRDLRRTIGALHGKAHGETDALAHDGALEEDAFAVRRDIARDDLVGQVVELIVHAVGVLVRNASYLAEHGAADLRQARIDAAHRSAMFSPLKGSGARIRAAPVLFRAVQLVRKTRAGMRRSA